MVLIFYFFPMPQNIYLDYASTTPTDPLVLKAMEPYWHKFYGNPSSLYQLGLKSKQAVLNSKKIISQILNCQPEEIIFTGSGTESINLAIKGPMMSVENGHVIISAIEHPAVLESANSLKKCGHQISILKVNNQGLINLFDLEKTIRDNTRLISVMMANNEVGTIQDIQKIGALIEKINNLRTKKNLPKIYFHSDACQAAGVLDLNVKKLHVDLLTINGSKIYGPKGIGALYIKNGTKIEAIISGGGQENNLRSGTENVPAIVGLATALKLADKNKNSENKRLIKLRDQLIKNILDKIPDTKLNGSTDKRLPNNVNISILNIEAESLVLYLDKIGIQSSVGSACSADSLEPSHVIKALGASDNEAKGTIRFSLGKYNTDKDIDYLVKNLTTIVKKLRK